MHRHFIYFARTASVCVQTHEQARVPTVILTVDQRARALPQQSISSEIDPVMSDVRLSYCAMIRSNTGLSVKLAHNDLRRAHLVIEPLQMQQLDLTPTTPDLFE